MKFKSKKEFAEAIIRHGKLYSENMEVSFDNNNAKESPFKIKYGKSMSMPMSFAWKKYNLEWSTEKPFEDKEPVWCWDVTDTTKREARFWDAKNGTSFYSYGKRSGYKYQNYSRIENPEPWMLEAQKRLED